MSTPKVYRVGCVTIGIIHSGIVIYGSKIITDIFSKKDKVVINVPSILKMSLLASFHTNISELIALKTADGVVEYVGTDYLIGWVLGILAFKGGRICKRIIEF